MNKNLVEKIVRDVLERGDSFSDTVRIREALLDPVKKLKADMQIALTATESSPYLYQVATSIDHFVSAVEYELDERGLKAEGLAFATGFVTFIKGIAATAPESKKKEIKEHMINGVNDAIDIVKGTSIGTRTFWNVVKTWAITFLSSIAAFLAGKYAIGAMAGSFISSLVTIYGTYRQLLHVMRDPDALESDKVILVNALESLKASL